MRFFHIADVHLGRKVDEDKPWGELASREIYDAFVTFVDCAENSNLDFLFITGDLFDHVPEKEELEWVDMQLARLSDTNIIYVTGEKDYLARGAAIWKYRFISRMYVLNGEKFNNSVSKEQQPVRTNYADAVVDCIYFEKYNLDIYGICLYNKFNDRCDIESAYTHDLNRLSICLAHGGEEHISPYDKEAMEHKNFKYIGLGHFHEMSMDEKNKVYYPGSLIPLSSEEMGEHGYIKGYLDEFVSTFKFVPLLDVQYKELNFQVDENTVNSQLVDTIVSECKKHKNYVYSIVLQRSERCYLDFDLSLLYKKYKIAVVKGDKFPKKDIEKIQQLNINNVFGENLRRISKVNDECALGALLLYSEKMNYILWKDDNVGITLMVADKENASKAHKEVTLQLSEEKKLVESGKQLVADEMNKVEEKLKKHPDRTGEINTANERRRKIEYEYNDKEFKENQIDKIYSRKKIGFILLCLIPVVCIHLFLGVNIVAVFLSRQWDAWWNAVVNTLVLTVVVVFGSNFLYDCMKRKGKNLEHIKYQNYMSAIMLEMQKVEDKLDELQKEQNKWLELKTEYKELDDRYTRLTERENAIKLILDME